MSKEQLLVVSDQSEARVEGQEIKKVISYQWSIDSCKYYCALK